jgi:endonuclease/exonuclease/phosphatase family metal-dependent hydrolase
MTLAPDVAQTLATRARHCSRFAAVHGMESTHEQVRPKRRIFLGLLSLFLLFITYRVFTVYTVRSGHCSPRPVDPNLRRLTRDAEGARVSYPVHVGTPTTTHPLLILSFNIEGHAALYDGDHIRKIAETIKTLHPDIVALQEVHRGTWQARFHDQPAELAKLTGLHAFFGRSYTNFGGEFGNAVLTRGDILSAAVHELPSIGEPRTMIESVIRIDGVTIDFYATHLVTWGKLNHESREEQLKCIARMVATSPHPWILSGDLNNVPEAPEVAAFIRSGVAQLSGVDLGPSHKYLKERIDYIFADWGWDVRSARVVNIGSSDHWPVVAELIWQRPESTIPSASGIGHDQQEKK